MRLLIAFLCVTLLLFAVVAWAVFFPNRELPGTAVAAPDGRGIHASDRSKHGQDALTAGADRRFSEAERPLPDLTATVADVVLQPPAVDGGPRPFPPAANAPASGVAAVRYPGSENQELAVRTLQRARAALASDPDSIAALRDEVAAARALGRWREVLAALDRLMELEPQVGEYGFEKGALLMQLHRWVEAGDTLRRVVDADPENDAALYNLAIVHQTLGRLAEARSAWDRVLKLRPNDADALARRGEACLDLQDWIAAIDDFSAAFHLDPDSADVAMNLATAYARLDRGDEARSTLEALVTRQPRNVPVLNHLAALAWAEYQGYPAGNDELRATVIESCERSLELAPNQPEVRALLDDARGSAPTGER
jgi:tetratricopeptide (TPR) repeat protein